MNCKEKNGAMVKAVEKIFIFKNFFPLAPQVRFAYAKHRL